MDQKTQLVFYYNYGEPNKLECLPLERFSELFVIESKATSLSTVRGTLGPLQDSALMVGSYTCSHLLD